jgi:chromosomal replication initiator protein
MIALHSCDDLGRAVDRLRVTDVLRVCAEQWDVDVGDVLSPACIRHFVHPRHAVCLITHEMLGKSSTQVGAVLGRDHTSVLSGCARARLLAQTDVSFRERLRGALRSLNLPDTLGENDNDE